MTKIYVDAGHATIKDGIFDCGAVGINKVRECDITLPISKFLSAALIRNGFKVKMSRDIVSTSKTVNDRAIECNKFGADLMCSIHINAFTDPNANGSEVYVYKKGGNAEKIANIIKNKIANALSMKNRGVNEGNFAVLRETSMPAILCEIGFITNKSDCAKIVEEKNQKAVAESICQGICEYFGKAYKSEKDMANLDNKPDEYAKKAVEWAIKTGILKGDENGNYNLHKAITRQDLICMIYRMANK